MDADQAIERFRTAMRAHGIVPPEHIQADGQLHRCDVDACNGKGDAAYLLHLDGIPAGGFQNWQNGGWQDWCVKEARTLTPQERAQFRAMVEQSRLQREDESARNHAEARERAREMWASGKPALAGHAYLARKGIRPDGLKIHHEALLVPVRDSSGQLHSVQFITADGEKRFLRGGRTSGCYHGMGTPNEVVVIAEGVATAASIHEATGYATVCAFNAVNLLPVAKALRAKFPMIRIIIGADNDLRDGENVGVVRAQEAARAVGGFVAVPELDGGKCDFNDLMLAKGAQSVCRAVDSAQPPLQPQVVEVRPVALVRELSAPDEYPIVALGRILAPAAQAIVEAVQVPAALAGNSVLAAAALCAQAHANVQTLGGFRPLSLYMLTVAVSGERKTSADYYALEPVREHARRLRIEYQKALRGFVADSEAHKARIKQIKDSAENADAIAEGLRAIQPPIPPRKPFLICTEPTAEGLIVSLQDGQLSQGVFSDEAGSFIGGHALSEDAELRTIATLSRAWDGSPLDRVRAKDRENTTLYGRRVSLHLMAQPDVAALMLGKALYRSQGFLARFLIAQPLSLIGTRMHDGRDLNMSDAPAMRTYWNALKLLLERAAHEHPDLEGLEPGSLRLLPEARLLLIESYNAIEADQRDDGPLSGVRDFASKAAEHACRIAGTLALVTDPEAMYVSLEDMERALTLVQFYIGEQERLAGAACVSIESRNALRLLEWMRRKAPAKVTASEVMKAGPNCIRESAAARSALRMLTENGWLEKDGRGYCLTPGARAEWRGG